MPDFADFGGQGLFFHKWDRVCEMWFETIAAWTNAFANAAFTKPSWAVQERYPFVEPLKDFVCTSILERPDQNMLKQYDGSIF